ncbi:TlpA family protein disulfide reductase [Priestia endophytica]|uniref:TlpA family protein disulfide reductase n=1 Tax=Priestia endophytica TaxID=135735 RepID=UPI00228141E9|nr:TlpA disulfide reductase family protein [Priestia endophytica]MCY8232186.1 TlpA family protein disulfide reductase [Priestia endophytica]
MWRKGLAVVLLLIMIGYTGWQMIQPKENKANGSYENGNVENNQTSMGIEEGKMAPSFTLSSLSGEEIALEHLKGKKVILNFWATWCPPCKKEMPEMQKISKAHGEEVEILAINSTDNEKSVKSVEDFIEEGGYTFTALLDPEGEVNGNLYKTVAFPTSYFINEEGKIVKRINGQLTEKEMLQFINS